jgi:diguanylate cyclase (GGDEF)-like protein
MPFIPKRLRLLIIITILLVIGFLSTSIASYWVSSQAIRSHIISNELPIAGDNIYSEIQKDILRPVFISSQMAQDTFLRDWLLNGEHNPEQLTRYLNEIQVKYQTVTTFLVSEKTRHYYHPTGIIREIKEQDQREAWYFHAKRMAAEYEINVDADQNYQNRMTIFINHRINDYNGNFIGITGVGLTLNSMSHLLKKYGTRFQRNVYFINKTGQIVLTAEPHISYPSIYTQPGLKNIATTIVNKNTTPQKLSYQLNGQLIQVNTRYIPELNWYLIVEQNETEELRPIQKILYINLVISALISFLVVFAAIYSINRNQRQLEKLANTDVLTHLLNRQAFEIIFSQKLAELSRKRQPLSCILLDVDYFKRVNDELGHLQGDMVLQQLAQLLKNSTRASDTLARWGGEEFILLLDNCPRHIASELAEKIRADVASYDFQLPVPRTITISLGVSELTVGDNGQSFFDRTDQLLYKAKENNRNCVMVG